MEGETKMKRFDKTNKELAEMYNNVINGTVDAQQFFTEITPVVNYIIATNFNITGPEADDISQDVMLKLMSEISEQKALSDSAKSFFRMRIINMIEKFLPAKSSEVALTEAYSICDTPIEEYADMSIMKDILRNRVATKLTEREQKVISLRFGLDGEELGLAKVGKILGVSQERVRQIEAKAIRKLRRDYGTRELQDFL